ncbi:MAG: alpha/beta hydrolase [Fuerstiella sp.]
MLKTLGGRQLWGDLIFLQGYRLQHHVLTGRYRLLDPNDVRIESGLESTCLKKLGQIQEEQKLQPETGRVVLLIHGIGRSSKCFSALVRALNAEGLRTIAFDYPSTRISIQQSVSYLQSVLDHLPDVEHIDVVCHSMGGLLLRSLLSTSCESRFSRAVFLGVPHHGAEVADYLKRNPLFKMVMGPAGQQLVTDPASGMNHMPIPEFEFATIAGGKGSSRGFNPLLPGDNDLTVTVESAQLEGSSDSLRLPVIHSLLMSDKRCIAAMIRFLETGRLRVDESQISTEVKV